MAGHGVGMLTPALLAQRAAARPAGPALRPGRRSSGPAYWLVYPEHKRNQPKIGAFRDWLLRRGRGRSAAPARPRRSASAKARRGSAARTAAGRRSAGEPAPSSQQPEQRAAARAAEVDQDDEDPATQAAEEIVARDGRAPRRSSAGRRSPGRDRPSRSGTPSASSRAIPAARSRSSREARICSRSCSAWIWSSARSAARGPARASCCLDPRSSSSSWPDLAVAAAISLPTSSPLISLSVSMPSAWSTASIPSLAELAGDAPDRA